MKNIVSVKVEKEGKVFSFSAGDIPLKKNERVIVHTDNGLSMGLVVSEVKSVPLHKLPTDLKNIVRKATEEDIRSSESNRGLEEEAFEFCFGKIRERGLPMNLVEVESNFDRSKLIFYFTADNRVDFRELVKDLVQRFKTRIELRQIGARNESRIFGGLGICGRKICCTNFLYNLDRVSIKMAKEQNMPLNPEKISGLCGRLMCCLAFEFDAYLDMKRGMPKCGKRITTPEGTGKVSRQNILKGTISVELEGGKEVEMDMKKMKGLQLQDNVVHPKK
ncbi:MAG TPA: stage 0 sporulation family protein [Syntrophales bacterium]|nr:stage 0 sporulation family protein [Syntrophales bacterium]HOX93548.1 stage 0 sporulation family protein [Syntrophales bacterium]HPI56749.1 stage 0 sporulation family protein [Syntrophales bacterium]HPN25940.1 stage 0 sporulation family protein [Syntrophales bacterium]HQM28778.1 stage 0 sporulation family protein [Syntrophales bacterium]